MEVLIDEKRQGVSRPFEEPKTKNPVEVWICKREGGCGCGCSEGQIEIIVTDTNPSGTIEPDSK